jgi:hypothetical protein
VITTAPRLWEAAAYVAQSMEAMSGARPFTIVAAALHEA